MLLVVRLFCLINNLFCLAQSFNLYLLRPVEDDNRFSEKQNINTMMFKVV